MCLAAPAPGQPPAPQVSVPLIEERYRQQLEQLMGMGFVDRAANIQGERFVCFDISVIMTLAALIVCEGDVNKAVQFLLQDRL